MTAAPQNCQQMNAEALRQIIRHHISMNTFHVEKDESVNIDAGGLELTLSEALANVNRVESCGAESNRHSGAVGAEKRAEQSNPGGGHVTEAQLSEPHEQKAAGMIPHPAAELAGEIESALDTFLHAIPGRDRALAGARLTDKLWTNKAGIIAYLKQAPHPLHHAQRPFTPELMNQTTVSCSGKEITIQCNNHDVKDALMDILVDGASSVTSTTRATPIDHSNEECPNFPGCHCVDQCIDGWKHPSPELSSTQSGGGK